jgi:hypothetical protein
MDSFIILTIIAKCSRIFAILFAIYALFKYIGFQQSRFNIIYHRTFYFGVFYYYVSLLIALYNKKNIQVVYNEFNW